MPFAAHRSAASHSLINLLWQPAHREKRSQKVS